MIRAGFQPGSQFLWDEHYAIYWNLTQRIYQEESDPKYDGPLKVCIPFCQPGTPNCDASYVYKERPQYVKDAVRKTSMTGDIGKPLLTLHRDVDALLPIRTDSGHGALEGGNATNTAIGGHRQGRTQRRDDDDRLNTRDEVRGNDGASGGPGRDICTADRGDAVSGC